MIKVAFMKGGFRIRGQDREKWEGLDEAFLDTERKGLNFYLLPWPVSLPLVGSGTMSIAPGVVIALL